MTISFAASKALHLSRAEKIWQGSHSRNEQTRHADRPGTLPQRGLRRARNEVIGHFLPTAVVSAVEPFAANFWGTASWRMTTSAPLRRTAGLSASIFIPISSANRPTASRSTQCSITFDRVVNLGGADHLALGCDYFS